MLPLLFAAEIGGGILVVPEEGGVNMWKTITDGVGSFTEGVLAPVTEVCTSNPIALAFLSVTFVNLGVRILRRVIGAFGRGR